MDSNNFSRSYEGKASQDNMPVTLVEALINEVFNLLGEVEVNATAKIKSKNWEEFVILYHNLKNRTRNIVDDKEYDVRLDSDPQDGCEKVRNYLYQLQKKGMFKVGQEEVVI